MDREGYLDYVDRVLGALDHTRLQYEYYRKAKQKRGLATLYRESDGSYIVSYSLCSRVDKFDRNIGLFKALTREDYIRIIPKNDGVVIDMLKNAVPPHSLKPLVLKMVGKAAYYAASNNNNCT